MNTPEETYTWRAAALGALLFIVYGVGMVLLALPFQQAAPSPGGRALFWLLVVCGFLVPYAGLALGWIRGFPRWSFPYLGLALFLSSYLQNVSSQGITLGVRVLMRPGAWGWRAWVPLALAALIALGVTRFSATPLRRLVRGAWDDWTRLSYAMFGCLPVLILFFFIEVSLVYQLIFLSLLAIIQIATAMLYLHSEPRRQRALTLLIGTALILTVLTIIPALVLGAEGGVDFWGMALAILVVLLLFFSPALIEVFKFIRARLARLWKA